MKRQFRIIVGMLLLAIPLCMNAQVKPTKPEKEQPKPKVEKVEKERPQKPEKPEKPEPKGGFEMPKISGFVQGMYQANLDDKGILKEGDDVSTFRMRRVRMSVEGKLSQKVSYKIQGDFVNSPMLVDGFIKYKACDAFAVQVGQFKTPFTLESPINPVNLEIFDYGEIIQKLSGYSDVCGVGGLGRDIGVMTTGNLFPIGNEDHKFPLINYSIGVFNGNGPVNFKKNEKGLDNNNRKDIVGRLEVHPGLKNLTLSGSYYYGKYYKDVENNGVRNRWSVGAQYNDGNLVLRGEYVNGETGYIRDYETEPLPSIYNSNGYYALAGYNFRIGKEKSQTLMPVFRYEHFTKDDSILNGGTNWYTAGINYWPLKSVNFKLDYSLIQKESGNNSHRVVGILSYKF